MKTIGIILIVLGIVMIVIKGFTLQTSEKVIDAGPLEVRKKENRWVSWPVYTGGICVIAGVLLMLNNRRNSS